MASTESDNSGSSCQTFRIGRSGGSSIPAPGSVSLAELDFDLPAELIAQRPAVGRDGSRLLVVDRAKGSVTDSKFLELPSFFNCQDLLVVNDTRVVPAKLRARRATGGIVSGLFVHEVHGNRWHVLLTQSARLKAGERLSLLPDKDGDALVLVEYQGGGRWCARLESNVSTEQVLNRVGRTPLPPYIRRGTDEPDGDDRVRYQTVFARNPGAVAAPTAALHFTEDSLRELDRRGIARTSLTLHVGPGTFVPVVTTRLDDHVMHAEQYALSPSAAEAIRECRARNGRVVAVGTTTARVLETCATDRGVRAASGWTDLFIRPPHRFFGVDALLTNFHLPRSTLLALVMAFGGEALIRRAYAHAVASRYRFYSYGDAMLIL